MTARPHKYGMRATSCGLSRAETARLAELELMQRAGEIADLETQVKFNVAPDGCDKIGLTVDFTYRDIAGSITGTPGQLVAEDTKGVIVRDATIRFKLFAWSHPAYRLMLSRAVYARVRGGSVIRDFNVFPFAERRKRANAAKGRRRAA